MFNREVLFFIFNQSRPMHLTILSVTTTLLIVIIMIIIVPTSKITYNMSLDRCSYKTYMSLTHTSSQTAMKSRQKMHFTVNHAIFPSGVKVECCHRHVNVVAASANVSFR